MKKENLLFLFFLIPSVLFAQPDVKSLEPHSLTWADSIYQAYDNRKITDVVFAMKELDEALTIFLSHKEICKAARIQSWRSHCYNVLGQNDSAIFVAQEGLKFFNKNCDSLVLMSIHVNLGNAWLSLGEFDKVKDLCEKSLKAWNKKWPYSISHNGLYTNRAIALAYMDDQAGALQAFRDILSNAIEENILSDEMDAYTNLAAFFCMKAESENAKTYLDSCTMYQKLAISMARKMGDKGAQLILFSNISISLRDQKKYNEALNYLDSAQVLVNEIKDLEMAVAIANTRSECLYLGGMPDSAYKTMRIFQLLSDSLINTEKVRAIADVQEKYESEKKEAQIALNEKEISKQKIIRNAFVGGFVVILLFAVVFFTQRNKINAGKKLSDELLLNILPEEVAEELKMKGSAEAKLFDHITVMFTDFKNFTQISERLTPSELVAEIHSCFKKFDDIISNHNIEKIKTIGDAYMCAGGLPVANTTHAVDIVSAALDIQQFMLQDRKQREKDGREIFEIRIGIHTGPVVAGIVGVKKYAYDIWGDTVNIAARMESSCEAGKVNISGGTYELIKEHFICTHRGKIHAKNKGEVDMYFVERAS